MRINKGEKTISTINTKNEQKINQNNTIVEDQLGGNLRRSTTEE
jgi:hypothetical protein